LRYALLPRRWRGICSVDAADDKEKGMKVTGAMWAVAVLGLGCSVGDRGAADGSGASADAGEWPDARRSDGSDARARGQRLLGLQASPAEGIDEAGAFEIANTAGINALMIGYGWPEVETAPGVFDDWAVDRDNAIYASDTVGIVLMVNPIETDWKHVPEDLRDLPFDHPTMIERFKTFLDHVIPRLADLRIETLLIGNEVNGYLGDHDEWAAYQTFYEAVGAHARTLRPGIKIGVETMFEGMVDTYPEKIEALNRSSDLLALTYYPVEATPVRGRLPRGDLTVIRDDLTRLARRFADKEIYIIETGYSSSTRLDSSQQEQADFVRETFAVWDDLAPRIRLLSFFMLHDFSREEIEGLYAALDMTEHPNYEDLVEGMTTVGLRTYAGEDKLAFPVLMQEAARRGWE
jgi:hypothetical protein